MRDTQFSTDPSTSPSISPSGSRRLPISGPLSLGDLLDRSFRLYRAGFWRFVLTAAVVLVPVGLITGLFSGRFMLSYLDVFSVLMETPDAANAPLGPFADGNFVGSGVVFAFFGLITTVLNGVVTLALTAQAIRLLHQDELTVGEGLRLGFRRFLSYLWMQIVRWVSIFFGAAVCSIPAFIAIFLVFFIFGAAGTGLDQFIGGVLVVIGFFILVLLAYLVALILILLPIAYLASRWIGAVPALMAENLGGVAALRRSWRLSKGQIWRCVGYTVLLYVLTSIVFGLPVSALQQILFLALPSSAFGLTFVLVTAISSVASMIFTPFYTCAVVLLYYDLRVRAEDYDLELRLAQAEASLQSGQTSPRSSSPSSSSSSSSLSSQTSLQTPSPQVPASEQDE